MTMIQFLSFFKWLLHSIIGFMQSCYLLGFNLFDWFVIMFLLRLAIGFTSKLFNTTMGSGSASAFIGAYRNKKFNDARERNFYAPKGEKKFIRR